MALEAGSKLGPYEIIEPAGAGGMGEVYKARDGRLDRMVAIKVLPSRTAHNADLRTRFEREAKAISSLNHPYICTLHDIGHENGTDYLVMEYIEGESLSDRLKKGPIEVDDALEIAVQIADALDTAHRKGLIHRDLKPANVMLTREGAKLLDFGLAKLKISHGVVEGVSGATHTTPLTGTGTIIGTLQYMSPEQLEGAEADARSDIFAFGALLYEMISGQRAFDGKSQASLIASIMGQTPPPISQVKPLAPPALDRLIKKCLAKDPEDRWQSARDLADELKWVSQSGSQAGIPAPVSARRRMRFRLAWGIAAIAILAAVALAGLYVQQVTKPVRVVRSAISSPEGAEFDGKAGGSIALSPDGNAIAFTASDSTNSGPSLYVRLLSSTAALPLPGTRGASFPFWSPDSRHIAFFTEGKLKKILATGGPALTVCDAPDGRGGSWNDNDVIIFTPNFEGIMHKVAAAGGESQPLTVLDTTHKDYTHRWATFLPDNDHFLFFARTGSGAGSERDGICLASLSNPLSIKRLVNTKSNPQYASGRVLFMRDEVLMAQPFDAGSGEFTDDAVPIAEQVSFLKGWAKGIFSATDFGQLVYRKGEINEGSQMVLLSPSGSIIDTVGVTEDYETFTLSHGGDRIAVVIEDQSSSNADVWILDIARGIKTRFTFDSGNDMLPIWSPDDSRLIWRSDRQNGRGLYTKRTDLADTATLLVPLEDAFWPWTFTNDGAEIIYSHVGKGGKSDLWRAPVNGEGDPRPIMQSEFGEWGASLSPDGRWLAYASDESGKPQVYVTPFPNPSSKWQISAEGGNFPKWNRAGNLIYFYDLDDHVYSAEVDGSGSVFRIGSLDLMFEKSAMYNWFELVNDGEKFLINHEEERSFQSQMVLVQNWQEELQD